MRILALRGQCECYLRSLATLHNTSKPLASECTTSCYTRTLRTSLTSGSSFLIFLWYDPQGLVMSSFEAGPPPAVEGSSRGQPPRGHQHRGQRGRRGGRGGHQLGRRDAPQDPRNPQPPPQHADFLQGVRAFMQQQQQQQQQQFQHPPPPLFSAEFVPRGGVHRRGGRPRGGQGQQERRDFDPEGGQGGSRQHLGHHPPRGGGRGRGRQRQQRNHQEQVGRDASGSTMTSHSVSHRAQ